MFVVEDVANADGANAPIAMSPVAIKPRSVVVVFLAVNILKLNKDRNYSL